MLIDLTDRKGMFYWQVDRKISPSQIKDIFLDRKNIFDPEITSKAIAYAMTLSGKTEKQSRVINIGKPISFGTINNAVPAIISDGTQIIIRMHPPQVKNGYFWVEKLASEAAIKAGAPSYKTYFIYDKRKEFDFDFMVMEKLPGKTMQSLWPIGSNLDAQLIRETGRYMALIHRVDVNGFGFFNNLKAKSENKLEGQYDTFREHVYSSFEDNLEALIEYDSITKSNAANIIKTFEKYEDLLDTDKGVLIHNDIADWNTLVDKDRVSGIIDWDECIAGDPVMDFAQWSLFFDDARLNHLKKGYGEISSLPDSFDEKLHLYRLRYLVSKMVLRLKKLSVDSKNEVLIKVIKRGHDVLKQEFSYFKI